MMYSLQLSTAKVIASIICLSSIIVATVLPNIRSFPAQASKQLSSGTALSHSLADVHYSQTPSQADEPAGSLLGIDMRVRYHFHCTHSSYSYIQFRWRVEHDPGQPHLVYQSFENIDFFGMKIQNGLDPIDFSASFHRSFCKQYQHITCFYTFSGDFEGTFYPIAAFVNTQFIDGVYPWKPTVIESCVARDARGREFCPNGTGEYCRVIRALVDAPKALNGRIYAPPRLKRVGV